jgi:basic membrane protein A and related proteins
MKRTLIVLLVTICFGSIIASGTLFAETIKVGLVTDMGKIDDRTFNEFAYKGMIRAAKDFGLKTSFIETLQPTDYDKNIEQFVTEGFHVIVTVGFMLGDATQAAARRHPNVKFVIVDFAYDPPLGNVIGLVFAEEQAGFLAGALAGLMSESKIVGMTAGPAIPPVVRFRKGFEAGVRYICPACDVLGVHIDSFTDPARGKTAALSQMDEGADIIFGAGGTTGSGALRGAAQAGAWVIGVDQDEYMTTFKEGKVPGADRILSSAMKRVDNAVYEAIRRSVTGSFKGGVIMSDLTNDGIGLAPFHETRPAIPARIETRLADIRDGLRSGKIQIPMD